MSKPDVALVKRLRDQTGVGMMDCNKALKENNNDYEKAVDWLRTKGIAAAAKKAGRATCEGLVGISADGNKAAVVEINSETDFVARNEQFQKFVEEVAKVALNLPENAATVEALQKQDMDGKTVEARLQELIAVIGENITLRRVARLSSDGFIASYVHNAATATTGRIGVIVALEGGSSEIMPDLGKKIAMHIAASKPTVVNREEVAEAEVAREKSVFMEQAKAQGQSDAVISKMIDGRMKKYFANVVLMEQPFVMDTGKKVAEFVQEAGVKVAGFKTFTLGQGLDKGQDDFAQEVYAQLNK